MQRAVRFVSLSLAKSWVNATVGEPAARDDAVRLLDQAAEWREATLIAGPPLVKNGKCFLGRWDGREPVLRELRKTQQQDWSIEPRPQTSDLLTAFRVQKQRSGERKRLDRPGDV